MTYGFSPLAAADLEELADYIARDNPARALGFLAELQDRCRRLADDPEAVLPHSDLGTDVRAVPFGRHLIFYTAGEDRIRIERIIGGSRSWLGVFN